MFDYEKFQKLNPEFVITEDHKRIFEALDKGNAHIFINGNAGAGKSMTVKAICKYYEDQNIVVTATTGVAAALLRDEGIPAATIYKALGIPVVQGYDPAEARPYNNNYRDLIASIDILVVDEVSMLKIDAFDYFLALLEACRFRGSIILTGDYLQLPPVITDDMYKFYEENYSGNWYFFNSPMYAMYNFQSMPLRRIFRQKDGDWKDILNRMRIGQTTQEDIEFINDRLVDANGLKKFQEEHPTAISIVSSNKLVQRNNELLLNKLTGEEVGIPSTIEGDFLTSDEFKTGKYPENLMLKVGAPVMITSNERTMSEDGVPVPPSYINGDVGVFESYSESEEGIETINVRLTKNDVLVHVVPYEVEASKVSFEKNEKGRIVAKTQVIGKWTNFPVVLYASSTIHKCQGITLDYGVVDLSSNWYAENAMYVCFSRFRSADGFVLTKPLKKEFIKNNKEAIAYALETGDLDKEPVAETPAQEEPKSVEPTNDSVRTELKAFMAKFNLTAEQVIAMLKPEETPVIEMVEQITPAEPSKDIEGFDDGALVEF